jgi:hypothetical protein
MIASGADVAPPDLGGQGRITAVPVPIRDVADLVIVVALPPEDPGEERQLGL